MNKSLKLRMKNENYKLASIDLFSGPGGLCTGFKWAGILPLIAVEWTDTTVEGLIYLATTRFHLGKSLEKMKERKDFCVSGWKI